jgi:hypothetical protein
VSPKTCICRLVTNRGGCQHVCCALSTVTQENCIATDKLYGLLLLLLLLSILYWAGDTGYCGSSPRPSSWSCLTGEVSLSGAVP